MASNKVIDLGHMSINYSPDNSFKAAGYSRGAEYHPGSELVSILTIKWYCVASIIGQGTKRLDFSVSGYLYKYPVVETVLNTYTVYSNDNESNFFDETFDEKLGGNKEVLGGE